MNEKRQNNILFVQPKEKSNTSDPAMYIMSLKRKAIDFGQFQMASKLSVLEKSITSQKNLSNKVLKSTMLKLLLLDAELNGLIAAKNMTENQVQR